MGIAIKDFGLFLDCGAFPPLYFARPKEKQQRRKSAAVQIVAS
jgi:hypothetical protein